MENESLLRISAEMEYTSHSYMKTKSSPKSKNFSPADRAYLKKRGISEAQALSQMDRFQRGFPFVRLEKPCTVQDGVWKLTPREEKSAEGFFRQKAPSQKIIKFVPASGAASRMFGFLLSDKPETEYLKKKFLKNIKRFAFYEELRKTLKKQGHDLSKLLRAKKIRPIADALLNSEGMNYLQAPKGMIAFHGGGKKARTAFEEQLAEAILFADKKGAVKIHFTLPADSRREVQKHLARAKKLFPKYRFILTDSVQSPATDCLAEDGKGRPVRDDHGRLVFRPAGHGALLRNLNRIQADAVYVKNIDNILPARKRKEADRWKKILIGIFLETQKGIFEAQKTLLQKEMRPEQALSVLRLAAKLGWRGKGRDDLSAFFNRPFRVGGVVVNAGEPGGGPFWVQDGKSFSKQIIESAEVNFGNKTQEKIWNASTHFNPVEFVCGVCDWRGKKYDLTRHADYERGIITKKSYQGRGIRAMELPGLWNGSMGDWITLFVEIPGSVFAPVKTVLDLLRKEHQAG